MAPGEPIPTLRAFLESEFAYALPAPGGSLRDGSILTNCDSDAFMASLAAAAKKEQGAGRSVVAFLDRKRRQIEEQSHFKVEIDVKIIQRINSWIRELAN